MAEQIGNLFFFFLIGREQPWGGAHGRASPGRGELSLEDETGIFRASCRRLGREGQASSLQAIIVLYIGQTCCHSWNLELIGTKALRSGG